MEQRKSKQDRQQKLHPIQCSAPFLRQLGIVSVNNHRQLVKNRDYTHNRVLSMNACYQAGIV